MYRVIFVDAFCPRPYSDQSLNSEPMGGTESAVTLLAESLSAYADVEVLQHCRKYPRVSERGVLYRGVGKIRTEAARGRNDVTIIINSPKILELWRRQNTRGPLILWRHNFLGNRYKKLDGLLRRTQAHMVCVSDHHRQECLSYLGSNQAHRQLHTIGNAVQAYHPDTVVRDINKLLFCSLPHNGLEECIQMFDVISQHLPSLKLSICNPGYLPTRSVQQANIEVLGALDRPALHKHMAQSLCVFYPQRVFSETFGLVAAEANQLGTPILAPSNHGALSEVVNGDGQMQNNIEPLHLVNVLKRWQRGSPPCIVGSTRYDPDTIARRWLVLIENVMSRDVVINTRKFLAVV